MSIAYASRSGGEHAAIDIINTQRGAVIIPKIELSEMGAGALAVAQGAGPAVLSAVYRTQTRQGFRAVARNAENVRVSRAPTQCG